MDIPVSEEAVREQVLVAFEYSHLHDDWVHPLAEALEGITVPEALWQPAPNTKGIWQIVLHMTVWTENIVQRMTDRTEGKPLSRPAEGAWPPLPDTPDETAWENAKQRLWDALTALRAHIEKTPLAAMLDPGTWGYSQLGDLFCRLIHIAYHIGQITKLRECYTALKSAS